MVGAELAQLHYIFEVRMVESETVAFKNFMTDLPAIEAQLLAARQPGLRVYELRSTGILRRHLGFCDVLLTIFEYWLLQWLPAALSALRALLVGARRPKPRTEASARTLVCVSLRPWTVHGAMLQHRSQYVWFRRLYVMVSGFVWVNTLVRR